LEPCFAGSVNLRAPQGRAVANLLFAITVID